MLDHVFTQLVTSHRNAFEAALLQRQAVEERFQVDVFLGDVSFETSYSLPGVLLEGMFGFRPTPTVGEALAYLVFLIPALALFLAPAPAPVAVLRRS